MNLFGFVIKKRETYARELDHAMYIGEYNYKRRFKQAERGKMLNESLNKILALSKSFASKKRLTKARREAISDFVLYIRDNFDN